MKKINLMLSTLKYYQLIILIILYLCFYLPWDPTLHNYNLFQLIYYIFMFGFLKLNEENLILFPYILIYIFRFSIYIFYLYLNIFLVIYLKIVIIYFIKIIKRNKKNLIVESGINKDQIKYEDNINKKIYIFILIDYINLVIFYINIKFFYYPPITINPILTLVYYLNLSPEIIGDLIGFLIFNIVIFISSIFFIISLILMIFQGIIKFRDKMKKRNIRNLSKKYKNNNLIERIKKSEKSLFYYIIPGSILFSIFCTNLYSIFLIQYMIFSIIIFIILIFSIILIVYGIFSRDF